MKDKIISCRDGDGKTHKIKTSDLVFRPAVYAVIIKNNKILLSKEWDGYDYPGGGIDKGEKTETALVREVKEETGLDIKVEKLLFCDSDVFCRQGSFNHSILLYYSCKVIGGEISTSQFTESEKKYKGLPEWILLDDLKNVRMYNSIDNEKLIKIALEV